ncbi:hypothetical protein A3H04_04275 [Candidatus Giovannonibacteria bacterium RIFCSPLOWO2_12_FULL_43_11c]|uniref:Uncharacterized protein n=1 Tax=Candidatus Giovannonibacteria bacterium RIFCSPHIGHO2_12_FULL_43_15 TaxID=1798341 RepID=A0A1F5WR37_9BACT|nr:MAG: hypothetical protein A2739_01510 [Candidatus Giovannonibacteria bacterium RIFCSPHIGHO2_01_FULL_43_100]OGF78126.1 MAG: hypothetical protein A3F23_02910 [Candidatus Giovannonibacteria bacterium RIFCSPHIGHO2_12_FULL_43_15]OGF78533.1 MAG: hypothetical protein A3A15_02810 [Candidatus Giovannonibacteria bacterium RIFCSPLOWO2_01_FULL_43_60]OGF92677.1 MAG: hypothetical protein A3H04_04275 [Candidatus Giovannonibacteria bacterium RIFCSPLOWO2_12_FULL_43_11c]
MNSETKTCQNCHNNFTIEPEDFKFYEKMQVPPPTFCPECRLQRRSMFRNERKLFWAKSAKSGKEILSLYPPESGFVIYDEKEWWSDDWDPMEYGKDYDFSRPFFEQFFELSKITPRYSRDVMNMVNSNYSANASDLKNSYLLFNSNFTEDSAYGNAVDDSAFCFDNSHLSKCERCYNSFWLTNCYQTNFSSQCEDCNNVWFSKNCRGCSDCFGCANLRGKKYHIFNEPYSKEDYEKKLHSLSLHTASGIDRAKAKANAFWSEFPNKYLQGIKNLNSSGEYVTNSKNVKHSYLIREGENMKYSQYMQVPPHKDLMDVTVGGNGMELSYEDVVCGWGKLYKVKFCAECWPDDVDLEYSMFCSSCSDLFGCMGLRKKRYCILNKQYSKEEYEALKEKIKKHMDEMPYIDKKGRIYKYGEFFPAEISPFAYNQTIAIQHFPLKKEEAEAQGFGWQESNRREYEITMKSEDIPDSINDVNESILKEVIQCAQCKRAYRLIKQELDFLKKEGIAAPRICVDCRHEERISQRNKARFYERQCMCDYKVFNNFSKHENHPEGRCPNKFETAYPPESKDIVYCEACYLKEVV